MTFLVQWQDYDNSYDKWIPWKEVRDNMHLHEYNSEMISPSPKEHRTGRFENYPVAVAQASHTATRNRNGCETTEEEEIEFNKMQQ